MGRTSLVPLSQHQVWCYKDPVQPAWVDLISRDREGLMDSVLIVDDPDKEDEEYVKVLYAVKPTDRYMALC